MAVDDLYDVDGDDTLDVADPGVLDNNTDANSALTAGVADDAQHGTLTLAPDGSFTCAPDGDFHGINSFTYEVCDEGNPALCDSATTRSRAATGDDRLYGGAGSDLLNGGSGVNFTQQSPGRSPDASGAPGRPGRLLLEAARGPRDRLGAVAADEPTRPRQTSEKAHP